MYTKNTIIGTLISAVIGANLMIAILLLNGSSLATLDPILIGTSAGVGASIGLIACAVMLPAYKRDLKKNLVLIETEREAKLDFIASQKGVITIAAVIPGSSLENRKEKVLFYFEDDKFKHLYFFISKSGFTLQNYNKPGTVMDIHYDTQGNITTKLIQTEAVAD